MACETASAPPKTEEQPPAKRARRSVVECLYRYLGVYTKGPSDKGKALGVPELYENMSVHEWLGTVLDVAHGVLKHLDVEIIGPEHLVTGTTMDAKTVTIKELGVFDTTTEGEDHVRLNVTHWMHPIKYNEFCVCWKPRLRAPKIEVSDHEQELFRLVSLMPWSNQLVFKGGPKHSLAVATAIREAVLFYGRLDTEKKLELVRTSAEESMKHVTIG